MRSPRRLGVALSAALCLTWGCNATKNAAGAPPKLTGENGAAQQLYLWQTDDRPALGLVAREGDPRAALALAVSHDFGAEASLALASLCVARLGAQGFTAVQSRAHGLGFVLSTLVSSPAEAARFVQASTNALRTPVGAGDAKLAPGPKLPSWSGKAQAAVAGCSGELGAPGPIEVPDAAALEQWRAQLGTARAVAFGAVGPRALLDAVSGALKNGSPWPKTGGPEDGWPGADVAGVAAAAGRERRLSIAYRISDGARAVELARSLGAPGSPLALRVGSLDGAWALDRVVATTRPRGACLRIDLGRARSEAPPRPADLARVAAVVDEETRPALGRAGDAWALDDAALRPSDPREAAAVAAWRALSGRLPGGPPRRFVSYVAAPDETGAAATGDLERALAAVEASWAKTSIVKRARVENGQGELYALLATPCATTSEGSENAGELALALRAIAAQRSGNLGVELEAWTGADGAGLLAHAPRLGSGETPAEQARRIGEALGRALALARLGGPDVARERSALFDELGGAEERPLDVALDALTGGHPSWLEPRGSARAVSELSVSELERRLRLLAQSPLRLAVLANADESQLGAVDAGLERWLRPLRQDSAPSCSSPGRPSAPGAELSVEIQEPPARAYVGLALPPDGAGLPRTAELAAYLLNKPGGWLEQALRALPGPPTAQASVLGGRNAAALVIEVRTLEGDPANAVAQVRALVDRLAKGAATDADIELGRRELERLDAEAALEPRHRVIDLWRGASSSPPDRGAFRRFERALAGARPVVVYAKPHE